MGVSPLAPYAVSKLAAEQYVRVAPIVYGLETVSLRYFNVFGRRQDPFSQYSAVIPKFIAAMRAGEAPVVYGTGEQSRDFTHIANVVEANLLAMTAPDAVGRVLNVGYGSPRSLNELVDRLNGLMGTSIQPSYAAPRSGDVLESWADISEARRTLGYDPSVDFEEGLRRTIDAFDEVAPAGLTLT
jgi:nucleoside-diphosphate-sugar epimerase